MYKYKHELQFTLFYIKEPKGGEIVNILVIMLLVRIIHRVSALNHISPFNMALTRDLA